MDSPPRASPLRIRASDFYTINRPSVCIRRVYLEATDVTPGPKNPYDEVLQELGKRHEASHLASLGPFLDLRPRGPDERTELTKEAVRRGENVIYQPRLTIEVELGGMRCTVVGEPDFLIRRDGGYVIRDAKMARRITEEDHPEALRQVETYGWLFERTFGVAAIALEIFSGTGDIVQIAHAAPELILMELEVILKLKTAPSEPYTPVGWTKCGACSYHQRCWTAAEETHDVALIPKVDQNLAIELRRTGVNSREQLLERFDEATLGEFERPWGKRTQRVGKAAGNIILTAEAMRDNRYILLQPPPIPAVPNFVVFDLEGLPPHLDELDKIFLWGFQVFGEKPGKYSGTVAGFGEGGDEQGWRAFLTAAASVFTEYGDIHWLHWAAYEKTKLTAYIARFGDPEGIAERIKRNLLDLLPVTQASVVLPLPSYSLKVVEGYVGFRRTQEEYGGTWAMAKFIEATECEQEAERDRLIGEILTYNEEDLKATWAVLEWLRGLSRK